MIDLFAGYDDNDLLKPSEVAGILSVDPKTVSRWAAAGKVPSVKTPGGHRRFRVGALRELLVEEG